MRECEVWHLSHGRPLLGRHRTRTAVGEKVDAAVLGVEQEDVVVGGGEGRGPFGPGGDLQGLGHLDAEGLDDWCACVLRVLVLDASSLPTFSHRASSAASVDDCGIAVRRVRL